MCHKYSDFATETLYNSFQTFCSRSNNLAVDDRRRRVPQHFGHVEQLLELVWAGDEEGVARVELGLLRLDRVPPLTSYIKYVFLNNYCGRDVVAAPLYEVPPDVPGRRALHHHRNVVPGHPGEGLK